MKIIASFVSGLLCSALVLAQDTPQPRTPTTPRKGSITGRVIADDGQPLPNVRVNVYATGNDDRTGRDTQTDAEGNFIAEGLPPAAYRISAWNNAYVPTEGNNPKDPKYYRLGETATLTLTKGGVISGRITDATGEPMIELGVSATRVRQLDGTKAKAEDNYRYTKLTDDRGRYRIYGLAPGSYIVQANAAAYYYRGGDAHLGEKPIYYPSTPRDGAQEITVNTGEEVRGIDIRYRGEPGFSLTGRILGGAAPAGSKYFGTINLTLKAAPSGNTLGRSWMDESTPERKFAFFGLADGEYVLEAEGTFGEKEKREYFKAPRRRVTIKGNDVTNLQLQLLPLGAIEGAIKVEALAERPADPKDTKPARQAWPEEVMLSLRYDDARSEDEDEQWNSRNRKAPNEKGEIKYHGVPVGRYRLTAHLPSEDWYVKAISAEPANAEPKPTATTTKTPKVTKLDVGKQGLNLKAGEKLKGLAITLAEGAAGLSGRLIAEKNKALPARLHVHLIPAEKEAADDVLRYYEETAQADGIFAFAHLAPGQYWLLLRPVVELEPLTRPLAWDNAARSKLRAEAEAKPKLIELKSCQRVNDYALKFAP